MEKGGSNPCVLCPISFSPSAAHSALHRQTAIYAQGVGLGASKGKDIESLPNGGYSSYDNVHGVARERYNDAS